MPRRVYNEAFASIRFCAENLDPSKITMALKLPPDHQHRNGEPRLTWTQSGDIKEYAPYQGGMWRLSSESHVCSPRLDVHLNWLLQLLEERSDAVALLLEDNIEADFFCYSLGLSEKPPSLPKSIRSRAKKLGISIVIDHYYDNPDIA